MIENEREADWLNEIFDSASSHDRLLIFLVPTVTNIYDNEIRASLEFRARETRRKMHCPGSGDRGGYNNIIAFAKIVSSYS